MKIMVLKLFCVMIVGLLLVPTSSASGFDEWNEGDEKRILGHSFDEEYWTASVTNESENGSATFSVFYVNSSDVQVFLVALNNVIGKEGKKGVLPYQLFGMHYYTPKGREVFIGAIFAFLMAYNDTNGNNIQDPGNEDVYYIIPFGLDDENGSYAPQINVHNVEKLEEGHYRFGITYTNLFAKIVDGNDPWSFWVSVALPVLHARFSELTVMYDVTIDDETGEVKAETYYTIGQVEVIRIWGAPAEPRDILNENWGISAVHYVSVFASWYKITSQETGHEINTGISAPAENISIKVGDKDDRAFDIGYRGTYDLLNESSSPHTTVAEDKNAYNILLQAKPADLILVGWQLGFSAGLFSLLSYALSENIQDQYSSPKDLRHKWWLNYAHTARLWYAVSFPGWRGYRVEHDPTYTAYFGASSSTPPDEDDDGRPCGLGSLLIIGAVCIPSIPVISKRTRRKKKL
ncbi:MAG: hypothetical protein JSV56_07890 [Methanomassiliicoccales archaeon]|nr:MAG: hypothetical protein JSV56_07890 [Methanomassiliicoccales archaeon]